MILNNQTLNNQTKQNIIGSNRTETTVPAKILGWYKKLNNLFPVIDRLLKQVSLKKDCILLFGMKLIVLRQTLSVWQPFM